MLVSIHQPHYFPYPGFFHKLLQSDAFIILDTVQYVKNEWINRNCLKGPAGKVFATIPVHYRYPQKINEVTIDDRSNWRQQHQNTIRSCCGRAPYFKKYFPLLEPCVKIESALLADYLVQHLRALFSLIGITIPVYVASQLSVTETDPTRRLIELCRKVGGTGYLSGPAGRDYLDENMFTRENISLQYQEYAPIQYDQLFPDKGFIMNLSIIDMLMNTDDNLLRLFRKPAATRQGRVPTET